jgi:diguanylate cyclase (GGDEF)-like protein
MAPVSITRFLIALLQVLIVLLTVSIDLEGQSLSKIVRAMCMMAIVVMVLVVPRRTISRFSLLASIVLVDLALLMTVTAERGHLTPSLNLAFLLTLTIAALSSTTRQFAGLSLVISALYGIALWWGGDNGEHMLLPIMLTMTAVIIGKVNITESEYQRIVAATEKERHDTMCDALTKLPNRAQFIERVWQAVRFTRNDNEFMFAVLFVDLDGFKPINDRLGHKAGDAVLVETAKRLQACLRKGDVVARYGGDEFTLLVHRISGKADVLRIADRILKKVNDPILVGQRVHVGASIGIALSSNIHERPEDLIRDADVAMYQAKAKGKGHYEVSDQIRDTKVTWKSTAGDPVS